MTRVPARSLVGVLALAVGVAAVGILVIVTSQFHGSAQAPCSATRCRCGCAGVDLAAGVTTVALGIFAIADALYLSIRERDTELAALRACGWSDGELGRLVVTEGAVLGTVGPVLGGAVGLAAMASFVGHVTGPMVATMLTVTAAGVALAVLAAAVPAQLMRRLPLATILAED